MPRVMLAAVLGVAAATGIAAPALFGWAQGPRVIAVSVKKFEFSVKEITARKGEPVIIELTSEDRVHGFALPAYGVRVDVVPGTTTRVALTPDRTGTFDFLCDVFCGDGHEDVTGTLVVRD